MNVASTYVPDPPDLDTRSNSMARSELALDIQQCPSCGYCAPTISRPLAVAKEFLAAESYRKCLENDSIPTPAGRFLCWSMIAGEAGQTADVIWAQIHAAWICDDAGTVEVARVCRRRAAELLNSIRDERQREQIVEGRGALFALRADLLRRCGDFDLAQVSAEDGLEITVDETIRRILVYEESLIAANDSALHTVAEALADPVDASVDHVTDPKRATACIPGDAVSNVESPGNLRQRDPPKLNIQADTKPDSRQRSFFVHLIIAIIALAIGPLVHAIGLIVELQ